MSNAAISQNVMKYATQQAPYCVSKNAQGNGYCLIGPDGIMAQSTVRDPLFQDCARLNRAFWLGGEQARRSAL